MSKRRVTRKHIGRAANVGIIARGRQGSAQAIAVSCSIMEGSVNSLSIDISLDCGAAVYWPDLNVLFSMRALQCHAMAAEMPNSALFSVSGETLCACPRLKEGSEAATEIRPALLVTACLYWVIAAMVVDRN